MQLEKDNLRLKAMNRRLRQYGQDVQEATREKEILRAKTRIHDQHRPRAAANPAVSFRHAGRCGKRLRRVAAEHPAAAGEIRPMNSGPDTFEQLCPRGAGDRRDHRAQRRHSPRRARKTRSWWRPPPTSA